MTYLLMLIQWQGNENGYMDWDRMNDDTSELINKVADSLSNKKIITVIKC